MSNSKKKRNQTFDALMEFVLDKDTPKELKERFKKGFDKNYFEIKLQKYKGNYDIIKEHDFTVTNRLLRFVVYTLYKNEVEYAKDEKQYPTFQSVAEFIAFINNYVVHLGYLSLILTSNHISGEIDIAVKGKIISHINYYGKEELPKNKYKGKYILIEIDSAHINKREGGNCTGGGHCTWFIDYPSPKKKYRKNERLIFEVDGEFIAETTAGELAKIAEQSVGDRDDWTISLDTTGYDEDLEDDEKNWYETKNHVYIKNFNLILDESY